MAEEKKYTAREAAIAVLAKAEEMLKSSKHKHIGWDKLHSKLEHEGYSKDSADKIAGSIKAKVQKSEPLKKDVVGATAANPVSRMDAGFGKVIVKGEGEGKKDESMAGNKKAPSNSNKPRIKEEPTERDYNNFETEPGKAKNDDHRQAQQVSPGNNMHEQAEGNNNDWGTDPGVKGHIKLAHFLGHRKGKKQMSASGMAPAQGASMEKNEEDRSKMSGKSGMVRGTTESNLNQKGVGQMGHKGSSGGISEAGAYHRDSMHGLKGGKAAAKEIHHNTLKDLKSMPKPNLTKKENPDEKQDAQLGEDVEHLCEDHMMANKSAERKEGHKIVQKSECFQCLGKSEKKQMKKGIALS